MKARFFDKQGVIVREILMVETPEIVSIPEIGEGREVIPGKAMMIAKFILRLYAFQGIHDGNIIYKETPAREIFRIIQKKQIPFSKDSFTKGSLDKNIIVIEPEKEED